MSAHPRGAEDEPQAGPPANLVWNKRGEAFWFHYTDRAAARAIVASRSYRVGARSSGPGLYVTPIMPGERTSTQLLNVLFDGTRDVERTQAAVVLANGPVHFERVDRHAWHFAAPAGEVLDLDLQIVGWAAKEAGEWLHSSSLYVE